MKHPTQTTRYTKQGDTKLATNSETTLLQLYGTLLLLLWLQEITLCSTDDSYSQLWLKLVSLLWQKACIFRSYSAGLVSLLVASIT